MDEVYECVASNMQGIQASIFTSLDSLEATGPLVDALSHSVSQISINTHGHRTGYCPPTVDRDNSAGNDATKDSAGACSHSNNQSCCTVKQKQSCCGVDTKPTPTELVLVDEFVTRPRPRTACILLSLLLLKHFIHLLGNQKCLHPSITINVMLLCTC